MTEQEQPAKRRIPAFKNREDEAVFWETHDTTHYEDEFRPVRVRFAQNLSVYGSLKWALTREVGRI